MVRGVWIGVLTPKKHTDHRTQQMVLDTSIKYLYAYKRTIDTIENLCVIVVGSIPRERSTSPTPRWWHAAGLLTYRSSIQPSQLCQLTVDS